MAKAEADAERTLSFSEAMPTSMAKMPRHTMAILETRISSASFALPFRNTVA